MTSKRISDQIHAIRAATEKASASPEAALAFLRSAGIISESNHVAGKGHKKGATVKVEGASYKLAAEGAVSSNASPVRSSHSRARYTAAKKSK